MGRIKAADRVGQSFGRLTVLAVVRRDSHGHAIMACYCECGEGVEVSIGDLVTEHTRSCGCLKKDSLTTHGLCGSSEYRTWANMLDRCINSNTPRYYDYGGRGIIVCDSWLKFENFYADMGNRPSPEHSIDRIDNNGPYCKDNCRWATVVEQNNNTRRTRTLTHNGRTQSLSQWASELGITHQALSDRLGRLGWSVDKALTTPSKIPKGG